MKRILLPVVIALAALSACSTTPPAEKPQASENHWQESGLRFPASIDNASLEDRYCSALSTFNMKISHAKGAISRATCQDLIRNNSAVCGYFSFCDSQNSSARAEGQARTRVNMMIDSLNEKIVGGARSIRSIDNLKFKSRLQETSGAVGFGDLFQQISNGQE